MRSVKSVALISMHTSPLHQAGSGDAGGMNVYLFNVARELACLGLTVDIFTRRDSPLDGAAPANTEEALVESPCPGVRVISLPVALGVSKNDLPAFAPAFAEAVLAEYGPYDAVHAHYWISGLVGERLAEAWSAPLLHTMHTLALVKERGRASGEPAESQERIDAEARLIAEADALIVNTPAEQADLQQLYSASPDRVSVISPGVDLSTFTSAGREQDRAASGVPGDTFHLLFVGRIQRLKGPQILVEAMAALPRETRVHLSIVGAQSGVAELDIQELICRLGVADRVSLHEPVAARELARWYRSADTVAMPSFAESFGLVALEAQACGTPVLAADVGGLPRAVSDGRTGLLVGSHDPREWARQIARLAGDRELLSSLSYAAPIHARAFGWQRTAMFTLQTYRMAAERCHSPRPEESRV